MTEVTRKLPQPLNSLVRGNPLPWKAVVCVIYITFDWKKNIRDNSIDILEKYQISLLQNV